VCYMQSSSHSPSLELHNNVECLIYN
jgi:hypothetical protein